MKLCINCKYYRKRFFFPNECRHPSNLKYNLENGQSHLLWEPDTMRNYYEICGCTKDGRWFEPKENVESKFGSLITDDYK